MKAIVIVVAALIAMPAWADIYKCKTTEGKTIYSDRPCPGAAQSQVVKPPPANVHYQEAVMADKERELRRTEDNRQERIRELEAGIARQEYAKQMAVENMYREQAAIRRQKRYANNNLAGAVWQQSLSDEMQAVSNRYGTEISAIDADIRNLRDERERLLRKQ